MSTQTTAARRGSTPYAAPRMAARMDAPTDKKPEGVYIGEALQRLAQSEGIPNAHQFALRFGIPYKHLNNLWNDTRRAGLPTIVEVAKRSGRTVAYFLGEESGLPVLGAMDAIGRITMDTRQIVAGLITLPEACSPYFPAGARLILEPSTYRDRAWLIVRTKASNEVWIAWASTKADLRLLKKPSGETVLYSEAHDIIGAIAEVIIPPPIPMDA